MNSRFKTNMHFKKTTSVLYSRFETKMLGRNLGNL